MILVVKKFFFIYARLLAAEADVLEALRQLNEKSFVRKRFELFLKFMFVRT